jgi:hypothetical protein
MRHACIRGSGRPGRSPVDRPAVGIGNGGCPLPCARPGRVSLPGPAGRSARGSRRWSVAWQLADAMWPVFLLPWTAICPICRNEDSSRLCSCVTRSTTRAPRDARKTPKRTEDPATGRQCLTASGSRAGETRRSGDATPATTCPSSDHPDPVRNDRYKLKYEVLHVTPSLGRR